MPLQLFLEYCASPPLDQILVTGTPSWPNTLVWLIHYLCFVRVWWSVYDAYLFCHQSWRYLFYIEDRLLSFSCVLPDIPYKAPFHSSWFAVGIWPHIGRSDTSHAAAIIKRTFDLYRFLHKGCKFRVTSPYNWGEKTWNLCSIWRKWYYSSSSSGGTCCSAGQGHTSAKAMIHPH